MSLFDELQEEAEGSAGRAHSRYAPSALKRILLCPRSVALSEAAGVAGRASKYAAEGTVAHTIAEAYLRGTTPEPVGRVIDQEGHKIVVDPDMHFHGQAYADYVRSLMVPGDVLFIETTVNLDAIVGKAANMYGHLDAAIWSPSRGLLIVIDYKYGAGIKVTALNNSQLMAYGLGAMHSIPSLDPDDVKAVSTHVFQPRVPGRVLPDLIHSVDLLRWGREEVAPVIASIEEDGALQAPLVTGDHCRFCPFLSQCTAMRERSKAAARKAFGAHPLTPAGMSDDEVADALDEVDVCEPWFEAVREEGKLRASKGAAIRNRKLVPTYGRRVWKDEKAAEQVLATRYNDEVLFGKPTLRSVAQIEKDITAEDADTFKTLWTPKSSGHSLVPISDPRPGVRIATAREVFGSAPF